MLPFTPHLSSTSEKVHTRDVRPRRAVWARRCQSPKQVFVCFTPCDIMMVMIMTLLWFTCWLLWENTNCWLLETLISLLLKCRFKDLGGQKRCSTRRSDIKCIFRPYVLFYELHSLSLLKRVEKPPPQIKLNIKAQRSKHQPEKEHMRNSCFKWGTSAAGGAWNQVRRHSWITGKTREDVTETSKWNTFTFPHRKAWS